MKVDQLASTISREKALATLRELTTREPVYYSLDHSIYDREAAHHLSGEIEQLPGENLADLLHRARDKRQTRVGLWDLAHAGTAIGIGAAVGGVGATVILALLGYHGAWLDWGARVAAGGTGLAILGGIVGKRLGSAMDRASVVRLQLEDLQSHFVREQNLRGAGAAAAG